VKGVAANQTRLVYPIFWLCVMMVSSGGLAGGDRAQVDTSNKKPLTSLFRG
jgi:hypothetical protein